MNSIWTRRLRIISGLTLFAFVVCHLLNVSAGLHSIEMMDRLRPYFMAVWTSGPGSLVLVLAISAHLVLGLVAIYRRNTLRMTRSDIVQMLASLAIVPLLTPHVVGTAIAARFGIEPTFRTLIPYFWIEQPIEGLRQVLLLSVLWIHGCIGVYTWARIQRWWTRIGGYLYPLAVAVPVIALLGFVEAGNQALDNLHSRHSTTQAAPPAASAAPTQPDIEPTGTTRTTEPQRSVDEILALLKQINWTVFYVYLVVVAATFAARQWRLRYGRQKARIRIVDGPDVVADAGLTLLEIAHLHHVPIANLCRGRGRCGTCRVSIQSSDAPLAPPDAMEAATLTRLGCAPDVRLACQMHPPAGDLIVKRLLPPYLRIANMHEQEAPEWIESQRSVDAA